MAQHTLKTSGAPPNQWGPIQLQPGILRSNMTVYVLGAVFTMLFSTFIPQAQPYLLTEVLRVPVSEQGMLSGYLGFAATLVGLIMPSIWGTISDKYGRRVVYAAGLAISALGIFLYPLAGSVFVLYLFRMIFQAGSNASNTMSNALLGDYIENKDRGKAYGMVAMSAGIGALLTVLVFLRLPAMFQNGGATAIDAGRYTYWIVAAIGLVAMVIILSGLQGKTQRQAEEKRGILQIAGDALQAAKEDPGISLAYGVNFVASGAVTAIGTFFTLWIVTYGTSQAGLTSAAALARAGMVMGITQIMGLVGAPLSGILADRVPRVLAVVLATGFTALAYGITLLVSNPLSSVMIFVGLFLGLVQISGVVTGGALIAQQTPEAVRGSVMGFYGFCGALGIMLVSVLGGTLFDQWIAQGPFALVAVLCALVAVWGLFVHRKMTHQEVRS